MSVEITPNAPATAAAGGGGVSGSTGAPPPPPAIDIIVYPHALGIVTAGGVKTYMIPFKVIEIMSLERRGDTWLLMIQTARQTINLATGKNLEADYRAACMAYNMG
jgi:hypothetical protein